MRRTVCSVPFFTVRQFRTYSSHIWMRQRSRTSCPSFALPWCVWYRQSSLAHSRARTNRLPAFLELLGCLILCICVPCLCTSCQLSECCLSSPIFFVWLKAIKQSSLMQKSGSPIPRDAAAFHLIQNVSGTAAKRAEIVVCTSIILPQAHWLPHRHPHKLICCLLASDTAQGNSIRVLCMM